MEEIISYEEVINQHTNEIVETLTKALKEIENNPVAMLSTLTGGLDEKLNDLGRDLVCEALENVEKEIYESNERLSEGWTVHKKDQSKSITTIFGQIDYERRYYKRKKKDSDQKEYTHLVDDFFGIESHQKIEPLVETRMIDLAAENSYAYSGMMAAYGEIFTDTTVMNKVHQLEGLEDKLSEKEVDDQKRTVDVLYIEADEDHISLQNGENTISRLVYVHEGYKNSESREDDKRNELKNVHYITGRYKESEEIWLEVLDYIDKNYHLDEIDKIFIGGDGDPWIKEGLGWIEGSKFILDQYHLNKYITSATAHSKDYRLKLW
ncbi:MAG: ISLre2 family transposase, partial [Bacillota bacterium]